MCGFAGIISWSDKHRVHRDVLARMSARIAHRGPDGEGIHLNHDGPASPGNPQVGLAHRRLAIIDLDPRSNQPFTDGRGRWLVFNGEIYNYRELRKELESLLPDYPWRTESDTEVLLASYAAWGEKCVEHLNGMFAFAIWDDRLGALFLARDRMGQKPLYVALRAPEDDPIDPSAGKLEPPAREDISRPVGSIVFASELSAIAGVPGISRNLCRPALGVYLSLGYIPNATIYNGIYKIDPSTTVSVWRSGVRRAQYFRSFAGFTDGPGRAGAVGTTRELVRQAVKRQLVADVPVGCFLSGGVDSSVVAAAMRAADPSAEVHTFSIGFDDPRYDETKFAVAVANHLGTTHHALSVRPDVVEVLPKLAAVFGEPFGDSSAIPTHYLSRETRGHVKVALSGDGGDELFGGYDRYRALDLTRRLAETGRPIVHALRFGAALFPGSHPKSRVTRLKRLLASAAERPAARYASYIRLFDPRLARELLGEPEASTAPVDTIERMFDVGLTARPLVPNALAVDRVTYLPDDLLTKVDRCSMLHALEVRSPFMDHELVEFAATLTTAQLLKGGPKRMLREAFANDLPAWVFKRKKMGFAVPIGEWFRGPLRAMLRDHLFAAGSFARGHFNIAVVERLVAEHGAERVDHSQRLYALLMLELWWAQAKA